MDAGFDGIVLRRQTKGVIADRKQNIIALHAALSRDHVHGGKGPRVADVQTLARRIGKLNQAEKLFLFV